MRNTQKDKQELLQTRKARLTAIRDRLEKSVHSGELTPIKKVFERLKSKHEKIKQESY